MRHRRGLHASSLKPLEEEESSSPNFLTLDVRWVRMLRFARDLRTSEDQAAALGLSLMHDPIHL